MQGHVKITALSNRAAELQNKHLAAVAQIWRNCHIRRTATSRPPFLEHRDIGHPSVHTSLLDCGNTPVDHVVAARSRVTSSTFVSRINKRRSVMLGGSIRSGPCFQPPRQRRVHVFIHRRVSETDALYVRGVHIFVLGEDAGEIRL